MEKYSKELCQLVINNIKQHENTIKVLDEIESNIEATLDEKLADLVKQESKNLNIKLLDDEDSTSFNWVENDEHWFSFDFCRKDENLVAFFYISPSNEDDYRSLSAMCGEMSEDNYLEVGLRFYPKNVNYNGYGSSKLFKEKLQKQFKLNPALQDNGFEHDNEFILRKFKFDLKQIADNYPDELAEAISPAIEAVEALFKCMGDFKKIIQHFSLLNNND